MYNIGRHSAIIFLKGDFTKIFYRRGWCYIAFLYLYPYLLLPHYVFIRHIVTFTIVTHVTYFQEFYDISCTRIIAYESYNITPQSVELPVFTNYNLVLQSCSTILFYYLVLQSCSPILFYNLVLQSRSSTATIDNSINLAIPCLRTGQRVKEWRGVYSASTSALSEKQRIGYLPIAVSRAPSDQKWAARAAEHETLEEALNELQLRLDGEKSRFTGMSEFFNLKPTKAPMLDASELSEYFFQTLEAGTDAQVSYDVMALKFLHWVPDGNKVFHKREGTIEAGMTEDQLIELYDLVKDRMLANSQTSSLVKTAASLPMDEHDQPIPKWALDLKAQVKALSISVASRVADTGRCDKPHDAVFNNCTDGGQEKVYEKHKSNRSKRSSRKKAKGRGLDGPKGCRFPGLLNVGDKSFSVDFLLDSGARTSILSVADEDIRKLIEGSGKAVKGVGGSQAIGPEMDCSFMFDCLPGQTFNHHIKPSNIPGEPALVLLGTDFLSKFNLTVFDWENDKVLIGDTWVYYASASSGTHPEMDISSDLTSKQREEILDIINKYAESVFVHNPKAPKQSSIGVHTITLKANLPHKDKVRRVPNKWREAVDTQVAEMLENDIIRESISPFSSNPVMVTKKDDTKRFCVDFRTLNSNTVKDTYPLPHVQR